MSDQRTQPNSFLSSFARTYMASCFSTCDANARPWFLDPGGSKMYDRSLKLVKLQKARTKAFYFNLSQ
jgi:hypothetical protein